MCGPLYPIPAEVRYLEAPQLASAAWRFEPSESPLERYNVAPTTRVQLLQPG